MVDSSSSSEADYDWLLFSVVALCIVLVALHVVYGVRFRGQSLGGRETSSLSSEENDNKSFSNSIPSDSQVRSQRNLHNDDDESNPLTMENISILSYNIGSHIGKGGSNRLQRMEVFLDFLRSLEEDPSPSSSSDCHSNEPDSPSSCLGKTTQSSTLLSDSLNSSPNKSLSLCSSSSTSASEVGRLPDVVCLQSVHVFGLGLVVLCGDYVMLRRKMIELGYHWHSDIMTNVPILGHSTGLVTFSRIPIVSPHPGYREFVFDRKYRGMLNYSGFVVCSVRLKHSQRLWTVVNAHLELRRSQQYRLAQMDEILRHMDDHLRTQVDSNCSNGNSNDDHSGKNNHSSDINGRTNNQLSSSSMLNDHGCYSYSSSSSRMTVSNNTSNPGTSNIFRHEVFEQMNNPIDRIRYVMQKLKDELIDSSSKISRPHRGNRKSKERGNLAEKKSLLKSSHFINNNHHSHSPKQSSETMVNNSSVNGNTVGGLSKSLRNRRSSGEEKSDESCTAAHLTDVVVHQQLQQHHRSEAEPTHRIGSGGSVILNTVDELRAKAQRMLSQHQALMRSRKKRYVDGYCSSSESDESPNHYCDDDNNLAVDSSDERGNGVRLDSTEQSMNDRDDYYCYSEEKNDSLINPQSMDNDSNRRSRFPVSSVYPTLPAHHQHSRHLRNNHHNRGECEKINIDSNTQKYGGSLCELGNHSEELLMLVGNLDVSDPNVSAHWNAMFPAEQSAEFAVQKKLDQLGVGRMVFSEQDSPLSGFGIYASDILFHSMKHKRRIHAPKSMDSALLSSGISSSIHHNRNQRGKVVVDSDDQAFGNRDEYDLKKIDKDRGFNSGFLVSFIV